LQYSTANVVAIIIHLFSQFLFAKIFAVSALLAIIIGIANMATKSNGLPKKQLFPSKKKASSPIKRELTTMTISTTKKMGKSTYVCKIMQFKNDFAAIWCVKQYHPNQDAFLHPFHIKVTKMLEFREAGFLTVINRHEHGGENTMALNSQDGYPRKLVIACPDENTHESCIECLAKVKEVRNEIAASFHNCLLFISLLFSHHFSCCFLLSNRKWSAQKTTGLDTPTSSMRTPTSLLPMTSLNQ
jgi:hypothetical protein